MGLLLDVSHGPCELGDADGASVVPVSPPERSLTRMTIPIGDSRARPFQPLCQAGQVEDGRQLQDHVDVVRHHANGQWTGSVPTGLLPQKSIEKDPNILGDERCALRGRPGEMQVEAGSHCCSEADVAHILMLEQTGGRTGFTQFHARITRVIKESRLLRVLQDALAPRASFRTRERLRHRR